MCDIRNLIVQFASIVRAMQDCKARAAIGIRSFCVANREMVLPIGNYFQEILSKFANCQRWRLHPCPQRSPQGLEGLLILQISDSCDVK